MKTAKIEDSAIYISNKKSILMGILNGFLIVICYVLLIYFSTGTFFRYLPLSISACFIIFCIFAAQFQCFKNYRVRINREYISFQALYNAKEPTKDNKYEWKDISMIIIGDVEVKTFRFSNTVFGVQIIYANKTNGTNKSEVLVSSLEHLVNYKELINDIKKKCIENNIKFKDE